jgi:putative peptidoglycan lipid II flippase
MVTMMMSSAYHPASPADARPEVTRSWSVNQQILRAVLSIGSATLLIRVMGMVNQVVVTSRFGAGQAMDAYFVALALPLLAAQLVMGAAQGSVVPVYARERAQGTHEQASRLFSTMVNAVLLGGAVCVVVMLIFRSGLIFLTAPALDPIRTGIALDLTIFVYPCFLVMVVIDLLECILNVEGQFGWPAYAGAVVPLSTAVLVLGASGSLGVEVLGIGMLVGLCLQLGLFTLRLRRARIVYRPVIDLRDPNIRLIGIAAWPLLFGELMVQASPFVDQVFASFLLPGSISALNYSLKLISVPVGVVFASVGRAALPHLSRQAATRDMAALKATLRLNIWVVGGATALLSLFMLVLAHPLVQLLFQRGAFSPDDTDRTASALRGFAIGLTPMAVGFLVPKAFNALGRSRMLMYVAMFSVAINAVLDYIFGRLWQTFGIALATSAVYLCATLVQIVVLRRIIGKLDLLTPPPQLLRMAHDAASAARRQYRRLCDNWVMERSSSWLASQGPRRLLVCLAAVVVALSAGVAIPFTDPIFAARVIIGVPIILLFLRFPYALLLAWVLTDAFIGQGVSALNGNNIDTALTVPSLLLLFLLPLRQTLRRMPALAFLAVYLLWVLADLGISHGDTLAFLKSWTLNFDYVAVGVITINAVTTRRRLMGLIDAILAVAAGIALFGIYGYITHQNGLLDSETGTFRITSTFDQATALALFLSMALPLLLYRSFTLNGLKRILVCVLGFLYVGALGLTFTRSALVTIPVSIFILISTLPTRRMKAIALVTSTALGGLVAVLVTIVGIPVFARFSQQDISSLNGRAYLWQALLAHFDPAQIMGHGFGAANDLLANLQIGNGGLPGNGVIATSPHSLYLGTLYDHGMVGLALLILTFISLSISLISGIGAGRGYDRALFATALAVCFSMWVQSIDSNQLWDQAFGIYFWIVVALPFARYWHERKLPADRHPATAVRDIVGEELGTRLTALPQKRERWGSGV